jgi:hypothetical protein
MSRRFLPLTLALVFTVGALTGRGFRPRPPFQTPQEAAVRLAEKGLRFHLVSLPASGDPSALTLRVYLTTTDKTAADLAQLPCSPSAARDWQGTVFCERVRPDVVYPDPDRQLCVGALLFYGDPYLLHEVGQLLR